MRVAGRCSEWGTLLAMTPRVVTPDRLVSRLAWASLFFTVAVILGGAVVRATDSGAGCGESWPRCEGHLLHFSAQGATLIEFTHRAMTGTLGIVLAALVVLVLRRYPRGHIVRRSYAWALGFFFGEVIIGAVLVLFGWVEDDASIGRVIAVSVHLVNTFLLLGALALTAHFASGRAPIRFDRSRRRDQAILAGVVTLLVIGASGALNALSDTLFPADTVLEGVRAEFGATAPFLLRIRTVHPLIAIAGGGIIFMLARSPLLDATGRAARFAGWAQALVGVQFVMGLINIALLTPVETQVLHLLLADALWLVWVLLGAELLGVRDRVREPVGDAA